MDDYKNLSIELNDKFPIYQEYFDELIDFYKDYFVNIKELECFLETIFSFEYDKTINRNIPRLMINNSMRLVNLADDMEKIRPGRDALKIAYFVTCIETLNNLIGKKFPSKVIVLIDFFENYVSKEDQDLVLKKVRRSLADASFVPGKTFEEKINMEIFSRIINETRNVFLHDGGYWNVLFSDDRTPYLRIINVEEQWEKGKKNVKPERVYTFELSYQEFREICVSGFINFIIEYMKKMQKEEVKS